MTIRRFSSSQSPDSEPFPARSVPWFSIGIAISSVALCGAVLAFVSAPSAQGIADTDWSDSARRATLSEAFGAAPLPADSLRRPAKMLSGIGAQTFSSGTRPIASAEGELPQILPNIAPVAWDRLSAGDCMTVTAKSGQTFSFRILGARPAGKPDPAADLAKIELAVSACAEMGEPVAKAVIQPTNPPAPKGTSAERSL